jgi:hypothetical protein
MRIQPLKKKVRDSYGEKAYLSIGANRGSDEYISISHVIIR